MGSWILTENARSRRILSRRIGICKKEEPLVELRFDNCILQTIRGEIPVLSYASLMDADL